MNFLRLILTLIVLIYFGFVIIAWGFAVGGDPILILDAFDMDAEMALEPWQLAIGLLMSIFFLATLAIIWLAAHRFVQSQKNNDHFTHRASESVRLLGWGLIALWPALYMLDSVLPFMFTYPTSPEDALEMLEIPIDLDTILPLVGIMLLRISSSLERGRLLEAEMKQII